MKTREHWFETYKLMQSNRPTTALEIMCFIAKIQRDAREGMVPIEHVRAPIRMATNALQKMGSITDETRLGWALQSLEDLRTLHPNLFSDSPDSTLPPSAQASHRSSGAE